MRPAEITQDGNYSYGTVQTEPQTPHSVNMGSPDQSNAMAWTSANGVPPGDSSVVKPSQTRSRLPKTQSQKAKPSYLDHKDEDDDAGNDAQPSRGRLLAPRQSQKTRSGQRQQSPDREGPESSPTRNPSHRASQQEMNGILPETHADEEDRDEADDGFTAPISLSQRPRRDSNDGPTFASSYRITSSQARPTVAVPDDGPVPTQNQKKNLPFLSRQGAKQSKNGVSGPSPQDVSRDLVHARLDSLQSDQPKAPQKLFRGMRGNSVMNSKATPKTRQKTQIAALDIEPDRSKNQGAVSGSIYDVQPVSRGTSPASTERKARSKAGPKKQVTAKYTKSKATAKVEKATKKQKNVTTRSAASSKQGPQAVLSKETTDDDLDLDAFLDVDAEANDGAVDVVDDGEAPDTEDCSSHPSRSHDSTSMKHDAETVNISSDQSESGCDDKNDDDYAEEMPQHKAAPRATRARAIKKVGLPTLSEIHSKPDSSDPIKESVGETAETNPKPAEFSKKAAKASPTEKDVSAKPQSKSTASAPFGVHQKTVEPRNASVAAKEEETKKSSPDGTLLPNGTHEREQLVGIADDAARKPLLIPFGPDGPKINGKKRRPVNVQSEKRPFSGSLATSRQEAQQHMSNVCEPEPPAASEDESDRDCQFIPIPTQEKFYDLEDDHLVGDVEEQAVFPDDDAVEEVLANDQQENLKNDAHGPDEPYAIETQPLDAMQATVATQSDYLQRNWDVSGGSSRSSRISLKRSVPGDELEDAQKVRQLQSAPRGIAQSLDAVRNGQASLHEISDGREERPVKKARVNVDVPKAAPKKQAQAVNRILYQDSDDVFGPEQSREPSLLTDDSIVQRLRTMPQAQHTGAMPVQPQAQQRPRDRKLRAGGPMVARSGTSGRPVQGNSPDLSNGGGMGRVVALNSLYHDDKRDEPLRQHPADSDDRTPSPGLEGGAEEIMHSIVTSVLQHLRSKSTAVHDVVGDYRAGCSSMVETIANKHAEERQQLIDYQAKTHKNYVEACENARHQVGSLGRELDAIQLDDIADHSSASSTLGRLKGLNFATLSR